MNRKNNFEKNKIKFVFLLGISISLFSSEKLCFATNSQLQDKIKNFNVDVITEAAASGDPKFIEEQKDFASAFNLLFKDNRERLRKVEKLEEKAKNFGRAPL